eukprot:4676058-Prymnesium_polylepis.1
MASRPPPRTPRLHARCSQARTAGLRPAPAARPRPSWRGWASAAGPCRLPGAGRRTPPCLQVWRERRRAGRRARAVLGG